MTVVFQRFRDCRDQRRNPPRRWSHILCLTLAGFAALAGQSAPAQPVAAAVPADPYETALALASTGRLDTALSILESWRPVTAAGREQKLWGRAVILRQMGRDASALPLLEQLVALRPDVPRFRIALSEVLAARGQKDRARLHIEQAFGGIETEDDRRRAARLLDTLNEARDLTGFFGLSFIPSTNPAQRTSARTVTINGVPFVINPSARKTAAYGMAIQAGVNYAPQIGPRTRLRLGVSGIAKRYDGSAPNELSLRAELGLRYEISTATAFEGSVTYSRRWIDGAGYSQGPGLTFGVVTYPDRRSRLQFAAAIERLNHDTASGLDGLRGLGVLSYARVITPQLTLTGGFGAERADTRMSSASYTALWGDLGVSYAFRGGLRVNLDASLRGTWYDGASPIFGLTRRDRQLRAGVEFSHARFHVGGFAPVFGVEFMKRMSNISIYSFDDVGARLSLTRRF